MKTKVLHSIFYVITAFLLLSFSDPYSLKRISDMNFRYEFYTTGKKVKPKAAKTYFWFKGGLIHSAQAGIAGELLHDKFTKMYHSNQLAEQGEFKNGLKVGLWRTWHPNGIVATTQYWNNGLKTGLFYRYDAQGEVVEKGNFQADRKHGAWIDYVKKDTAHFKRGSVLIAKPKLSKAEKAKIKEEKKKAKALKEGERKSKKAKKTTEKADKKPASAGANKTKKENFFTRLFGKKQSKQNTNGQGT